MEDKPKENRVGAESIKNDTLINLFEKREELRFIVKCYKELEVELKETDRSIWDKVREYNEHRILAFMELLKEQGFAWCNGCKSIQLNQDFELLLLKGQEYYEHGYGNMFYGYRDFSKLHYCCPKCASVHHMRSGFEKGGECTYAYSVTETADGLFLDSRGRELDGEKYKIPLPKTYEVSDVMEQMGLPPELTPELSSYKNPTLIKKFTRSRKLVHFVSFKAIKYKILEKRGVCSTLPLLRQLLLSRRNASAN